MNEISLTTEEKYILSFIEKYLRKKNVSRIVELISFLVNQLRKNANYNEYKIEKIVKSLISKKIILVGSQLTKSDILQIPLRKNIYHLITKNPGININNIKSILKIGTNQTLWHLNFLEKFEFIRTHNFQNQKALYPHALNDENDEILYYLNKIKVKQIIQLLIDNKSPLKPTQISNSLSIHYNTIKKYLNNLEKFKILARVGESKQKEYAINIIVYDKFINFLNNGTNFS